MHLYSVYKDLSIFSEHLILILKIPGVFVGIHNFNQILQCQTIPTAQSI